MLYLVYLGVNKVSVLFCSVLFIKLSSCHKIDVLNNMVNMLLWRLVYWFLKESQLVCSPDVHVIDKVTQPGMGCIHVYWFL